MVVDANLTSGGLLSIRILSHNDPREETSISLELWGYSTKGRGKTEIRIIWGDFSAYVCQTLPLPSIHTHSMFSLTVYVLFSAFLF